MNKKERVTNYNKSKNVKNLDWCLWKILRLKLNGNYTHPSPNALIKQIKLYLDLYTFLFIYVS